MDSIAAEEISEHIKVGGGPILDFASNTEKRSEISRKLKGLPKICVLPAKRNFGPLPTLMFSIVAQEVSAEHGTQKFQLRAKRRRQAFKEF